MTPDITFTIIFLILITYGLFRPFENIFSKMFLIFGSSLGLLSVLNLDTVDYIGRMVGIAKGADLYVYLGLITSFLFILSLLNRFNRLESKINTLAKNIALIDKDNANKDINNTKAEDG
tara:strand:- start:68 stop:424 length:357 start_codon:yes stop_codon:yes gene_type:complete